MAQVFDSYYVGRTGRTRTVRGTFRFWRKFEQVEVIVETYDTNMPTNRSQHNEWVTVNDHVMSRPVLKK